MKKRIPEQNLFKWLVIVLIFSIGLVGVLFFNYWLTNYNESLEEALKNPNTNPAWLAKLSKGYLYAMDPPYAALSIISCIIMIFISLYIVFEITKIILHLVKKYKIVKKGETNQAN